MKKFDPLKEKCELCGSTDIHHFFSTASSINIFKCYACKIKFMNPQYTDEYLADYYSKYTHTDSEWNEELFLSHQFCLNLIEQHNNSKGKLFDIGCGYGHLIDLARKRGWEAIGYDVDCSTVDRIKYKLNLQIYCGDFLKLELEENYFDVITMLHVIEHLKNPQDYLKIISHILKDNGIFFLALPNINSRSAIFKSFLERLGFRKKNKGAYYDTDHHLWYYSPASIKNTLGRFGFEVIDMRSGRHVKDIKSKLKIFIVENILDKILWRSTMLVTARKAK